jgi:hypothetical protein
MDKGKHKGRGGGSPNHNNNGALDFTISVVNLKARQRTPTFFQVYGTHCLEQTESSHLGKKVHEMTNVWVL